MLKLNVGLSRKIGEANYGSRGASVNLDLEVESALVDDPDTLRNRIRQLFRLAKASVDEELNGGQPTNGSQTNSDQGSASNPRPATQSQIRAIHAIANRRHVDVPGLVSDRFSVGQVDDLSISQASQLIDELKSNGNGNGNGNGNRQ